MEEKGQLRRAEAMAERGAKEGSFEHRLPRKKASKKAIVPASICSLPKVSASVSVSVVPNTGKLCEGDNKADNRHSGCVRGCQYRGDA